MGELWAVWFDGETGQHIVAKSELPDFSFDRTTFAARAGTAELGPGALRGSAQSRGHQIEWDLSFAGSAAPLFLLPPELYSRGLPKAKSLVGLPMARYRGMLKVDGREMAIDDWLGSQNHNWGTRHTDRYAWGQVAGFDNAPDSFPEVATARLRFGPVWTPHITPLVLRHGGQEYALRSIWQAVANASGRFGYFQWKFQSGAPRLFIEGTIEAPRQAFVGLRYYNPPGGEKWCLNSKIASCRLVLKREGQPDEVLETKNRAAFEILTDDTSHGVEIRT